MMGIPEHILKILKKRIFATTTDEIQKEVDFFNKLSSKKIVENSVLLIEPNDCHSECLPSYVNYFLQAGFDVDLFISTRNYQENAFVYSDFSKNKFRIFSFDKPFSTEEFYEYLKNYKYILLTTLTFFCIIPNVYDLYVNMLVENYSKRYNKNNLFVINHEVDFSENTADIEEYLKAKTFVLRPNVKRKLSDIKIPFLSPTYFGQFSNLQKNRNEKYTKFLCVGGTYKKNLRNFDTLFETVKKLSKIYSGQFEIIYVGNADENFKEKITCENLNVKFTGRVNFAELYKYVIDSDFILFNIDKHSVEYERYLTKKISGSYSLSLGFLRPGIVDTQLAESYNLLGGSITYSDEKLYEAMENAIKMQNKEYVNLEKYLSTLNEDLKRQSLNNIKEYFCA